MSSRAPLPAGDGLGPDWPGGGRLPGSSSYTTVALSIAGSDSGGGAGIQADLRAFTFFRVFGTTAITAVTAQNPDGVTGVTAIPASQVRRQVAAVFAAFDVRAVKTGMLFRAGIIRATADSLRCRGRAVPLVVDPVMVATSGARLLQEDAVKALQDVLLPLATVVTPNLPEAEVLLGRSLRTAAEAEAAARELAVASGALVVVKGGHAGSTRRATDVVSDGSRVWRLSCPRVKAPTTHGTGCSLSAALAANLALGCDPVAALCRAKAYVYGALCHCARVGSAAWAMTEPPELPLDAVVLRGR